MAKHITKEEFEAQWIKRTGRSITKYHEERITLPCPDCEFHECQGWRSVPIEFKDDYNEDGTYNWDAIFMLPPADVEAFLPATLKSGGKTRAAMVQLGIAPDEAVSVIACQIPDWAGD